MDTAELGELVRSRLITGHNPYGISWAVARNAIRGHPAGLDIRASRLYKDGTEYINGLAPTKYFSNIAADPVCVTVAADRNVNQGGAYIKGYGSMIRRMSPHIPLNLNGVQVPLANIGVTPIDPNLVIAMNNQIRDAILRTIAPALDPTGLGVFQNWSGAGVGALNHEVEQGNVLQSRQDPNSIRLLDKSGNVRQKSQHANGPLRIASRYRTNIP
jgi:hypothetical protein